MHIYWGGLKYMTVALPPLVEQAAIVRFLDHADRRIQRYIRARQQLIALLEEQAIIHQAVTDQVDARTGQPYPVLGRLRGKPFSRPSLPGEPL